MRSINESGAGRVWSPHRSHKPGATAVRICHPHPIKTFVINSLMDDKNLWKGFSRKLIMTMRTLFVATITWDFFLTVVIKTSQRAHVLMGPGAVFAPFLIIIWAVVIMGLCYILLDVVRIQSPAIEAENRRKYTAYGLLLLTIILYISLTILAIMNPVVMWPVVVNFAVNLGWGVALFYFRNKFMSILNSEE